jgi:hypothetical protein
VNTVGGGQQWEQLRGITTHPVTGYRLPSKQNISYALAIMNAGRIEDVLGVNASPRVGGEIYKLKGVPYQTFFFSKGFSVLDALLALQRIAFVAILIWLAVLSVRGLKKWKVEDEAARSRWILLLWFIVPLAVFWVAGLWTYLTYFVVLYPMHFLAFGAGVELVARKVKPVIAYVAVAILATGNVLFMLDYYRFVQQNGGAQGTFGTALGTKQQVARYLAEQGGERLRAGCETQLAFATAPTQEERAALGRKIGQPQLVELNHEGQAELPQLEWPLLVTQQPTGQGAWPTNMTVLLVDGNREALQPQQWQQLEQWPKTNFGPIRIYFVKR